MKLIKLQILLAIISVNCVRAQVLSYDFYTFKLNNMYNVNPAYAGNSDGVNVVISAQSQNKGVAYANKNFMGGVYGKISKKQAIGGRIISDTRGAFQLLKIDLSYAYIAKINTNSSISFGINAGILNNNLMVSRIENYQALDASDPTLTKSYFNTTQFAAGAGLLYKYKSLDVSVSLPHIITTSQPLIGYTHAAIFYTIKAGEKFKITPWLCYQNIPVTKSLTSFYVKGTYKNLVWLQVGYQSNKTFAGAIGLNVENIAIGYGYTISNSNFNPISTGTHELTINFKIPQKNKSANSNVTSDNSSLNDIVNRLDKLLAEPITSDNKANIRAELEKVKQQLQKAEIDNSTPEKAADVSKKVQLIDEKLKLIEARLLN